MMARMGPWLLVWSAALAPAGGQGYEWSTRGYADVRFFDFAGAETDPIEVDLRIRPRFKLSYPDGASLVIEPQAFYPIGRGQDDYRRFGHVVTLERLYAQIEATRADVIIGKQAVNWGSGIVFNPTDVFDDVDLRDVRAEPTGHTALRVAVPLATTRDLMGLVASDDEMQKALVAARGRATVGTTDVALVASRNPFRRSDMAGVDVKGEAKVGLWLEAAWWKPWDGDGHLRAVAGTDYTFDVRDALYLALQYYHDGSGASDRRDYDLAAFARRERATLARSYATLTGRLAWSPDVTFGTLTVANLDDGSVLATVFGEVTRIKNVTVSVGTTWLTGRSGGEFHPPPEIDTMGLLPDAIVYVWGRYHF